MLSAKAAEAEVKRLREALERVRQLEHTWDRSLGAAGLGLILYGGRRDALRAKLRCQEELSAALGSPS